MYDRFIWSNWILVITKLTKNPSVVALVWSTAMYGAKAWTNMKANWMTLLFIKTTGQMRVTHPTYGCTASGHTGDILPVVGQTAALHYLVPINDNMTIHHKLH